MSELFQENLIPIETLDSIFVSTDGGSIYGSNIFGGMIEGSSFRTSSDGARLEMFPEWDPTIGLVVYNAAGLETFKIEIDGANTGDVTFGDYANDNGILWDNSAGVLYVKGSISVIANWSEVVDDDGKKPEDNATLGADWSSDLDNIPSTLGAPSGSGLFLGATYMGYYTGGAWTTYIDSSGNMLLGDAAGGNKGLSWNQSTGVLLVRGNITADDITAGGTITGVGFKTDTGTADHYQRIELTSSLANFYNTDNTLCGQIYGYVSDGDPGLFITADGTNPNLWLNVPAGGTIGFSAGGAIQAYVTDSGYFHIPGDAGLDIGSNNQVCTLDMEVDHILSDDLTMYLYATNVGTGTRTCGLVFYQPKDATGYIAPYSSASASLGAAGNKFNNLYLSGSIVIDGNVDGVNIASHHSRHIYGGGDAVIVDSASNGSAYGISSNWAYDHDADVAAHHHKYTDSDARSGVTGSDLPGGLQLNNHNISDVNTLGLKAVTSNPDSNGQMAYYDSGGTQEIRVRVGGTVYAVALNNI